MNWDQITRSSLRVAIWPKQCYLFLPNRFHMKHPSKLISIWATKSHHSRCRAISWIKMEGSRHAQTKRLNQAKEFIRRWICLSKFMTGTSCKLQLRFSIAMKRNRFPQRLLFWRMVKSKRERLSPLVRIPKQVWTFKWPAKQKKSTRKLTWGLLYRQSLQCWWTNRRSRKENWRAPERQQVDS